MLRHAAGCQTLVGLSLGLCLVGCGGVAEEGGALGAAVSAASQSCKGPPYPIILAHGLAGFEQIGPIEYFFEVPQDLRARGEQIYISKVSPFDSSEVRGATLAQDIDDTLQASGACKVNIIAHSQGGLDARYAISSLHYGDKVAGLVTVGTPNLGSPVADAALGLIPGMSYTLIDAALKMYQDLCDMSGTVDLHASLVQLSTSNMTQNFNPQNPDDPRVKYYSVAGRSAMAIANDECSDGLWPNSQRGSLLNALFVLPEVLFTEPNDGLVAISSAKWGQFLGCEPADHLDEIGQFTELVPGPISGFYHIYMYRAIVENLHADGF